MDTQYMACFLLRGEYRIVGINAKVSNQVSAEENTNSIRIALQDKVRQLLSEEGIEGVIPINTALKGIVVHSINPILPT